MSRSVDSSFIFLSFVFAH